MEDNNELEKNNPSQTPNEEQNEEQNQFSEELKQQTNLLDAEKFAAQQEKYRQILPDMQTNQNLDNVQHTSNPYFFRVGFGRRLGAYLIDYVFIVLFLLIASFATGLADELIELVGDGLDITNPAYIQTLSEFVIHRFLPLSLVVNMIYFSLEVIFAQTIGKMLLGIIIGSEDRKFASYKQLLARFFIKHIDIFVNLVFVITAMQLFETVGTILSYIIFFGCLFVFGAKKQALHDSIAKTAVYFKDELMQINEGIYNK